MNTKNHDYYESYKKARNKSWEALIKCHIDTLPIDLWKIAKHYGIPIQLYSTSPFMQLLREDVRAGDGFAAIIGGVKTIFINDKLGSARRRRFTMAHELGHCILEHPLDEIQFRNSEIDCQEQSIIEYETNVFARDLLMPAIVLAKLNVHTALEISELCNVSIKSADIRIERLKELYKREQEFLQRKGISCFGLDKRECQVLNQFTNYLMN